MRINLNNMKVNDEWITPIEALKPLMHEFKLKGVSCCDPFGSKTSNFNVFEKELDAKVLKEDFFEKDDSFFGGETIITNPPFSNKNQVLLRVMDLYYRKYIKGFALLLPLQTLQGVSRAGIFKTIENTVRVRIFSKRIKYIYPDGITQSKSCMFGSVWICYGEQFLKNTNLGWY